VGAGRLQQESTLSRNDFRQSPYSTSNPYKTIVEGLENHRAMNWLDF
jgi:hypothetical protein